MRPTLAIIILALLVIIAAILSVAVDAKKHHNKRARPGKLQQLEPVRGGDCDCTTNNCECCGDIKAKTFGHTWSANACVSAAVDFDTESASIALEVDGHNLFNKTFTTGDIPKWCVDYLGADICLELENTYFNQHCFASDADIGLSIFGKGFGP
eukprot:GEZU01013746.1.p1 GENE.GEZU01013746.1~~GEZU01013746.1.p1  ORF type:complete len:154 (-),score=62.13 GEZU01013746.1:204-665(-)